MITRKASEVIRLAETMSQILNADALSWHDKTDMLNQSYIRLYNDLNNSGELYYSKEYLPENAPITSGSEIRIPLPKDFWKLLFVGYKSVLGECVPLQRAPNGSQYYSGYRVVNNDLVMSSFLLPGPMVIKYIPKPQTITYPRPGFRIPGNQAQVAYDSIANKVISAGAGSISILDITSGAELVREIEGPFILAISAGIIYTVKTTGIFCFDYDFNEVSTLEGTFDLYAHSIGWEAGIIATQSGGPQKYVSGGTLESALDHWNFLDGNINKTGDNFVYTDGETETDITEFFAGADTYVIADPYIYINSGGSVKVYDSDFSQTDIAPATIGKGSRKGIVLAAEANNETGFGIVFHDFYSGNSILGYAPNTVLNYPNNVFFDWLTADLAVKFRIALDIPTGELPAIADDYHDTLMRTLKRDSFKMQRINNVYTNMARFY